MLLEGSAPIPEARSIGIWTGPRNTIWHGTGDPNDTQTAL